MKCFFRIGFFLLGVLFLQVAVTDSWASKQWFEIDEDQVEWGGHLRSRGVLSWPDDDSFLQPGDTDTFADGSLDFRLKNKIFPSDWWNFETHYEAVALGGDTWRKKKELTRDHPHLFDLLFGAQLSDDRRLLDLSKTISETSDYIIYHRLDRLVLTLLPQWGTVRIGRQALTWGNGLLFNPMDLFNPFAPTDIERDYKIGDDMVLVDLPMNAWGDVQFLCVPRRNPTNNNLEYDQSSLAGKVHFAAGTTEFDVMAAHHYDDFVTGIGTTGYLREAAWRLDATYTFLDENSSRDGFFSMVANLDYSWVWRGKNMYGLLEFYYNGLGSDQYSEALADPDIVQRLARGELFTLGKKYLSGTAQVELHPLVNIYLTLINNVSDPSGIFQPRALWDARQNIQITFGTNIYYGGSGTEFGGFQIPGTNFSSKSPNSVYLWLTCFF